MGEKSLREDWSGRSDETNFYGISQQSPHGVVSPREPPIEFEPMLWFEKVASGSWQLQEVRNINGETKRDLSDVETNLVLGGGSRHGGEAHPLTKGLIVPPAQVPERRFRSLGYWMICISANMNLPTRVLKRRIGAWKPTKGGMTSSSSEVPQGHPLGSVFEAQGFSRTPWGSHRIKPVDFGTGGFVGTIFSRGASKSRTLSKKWSSQRWFWTLASQMTVVVSVDGWPCSGCWKKR